MTEEARTQQIDWLQARIRYLETRLSKYERESARRVRHRPHCQQRLDSPGSKFLGYYENALAKLERMGLTPRQIESLQEFGLLANDAVTGFHEGRFGKGRISTLRRAVQHVKGTGEQAFYVEIDLQNLCGLNAALGHTGANHVYARIAAIIRKELSAAASEAVFFRHGGDEMSAILIETTEEANQAAMEAVRSRVALLAKRRHLDDIPHPKHPGDVRWTGIGVYFGVCRLSPDHEKNLTVVFSRADTELERQKSCSLVASRACAGVSAICSIRREENPSRGKAVQGQSGHCGFQRGTS
jgi:diguanylate cyclase (GGDEF)-like protein